MNVTVSDSKDEGISKSLTKCFSRMVDARQVQDEVLRYYGRAEESTPVRSSQLEGVEHFKFLIS
jgi:hypothetical protein